MQDLEKMANELGEAIKESKIFTSYQEAKDKYDADDALQKLIGDFNLKKMSAMNEMQKENDKDEQKLAQYQEQMRAAYADILKTPTYTEFNEAQHDLEDMINRIYGIINYHVTGKEPGCSGSCDSCGGCH